MRKIIIMLLFIMASTVAAFAAKGDTTEIRASRIISIIPDTTISSTGREIVTINVVYKDVENRKRLAYMNKPDYYRLLQSAKHGLDIRFYLVEMTNDMKLIVR